MATYKGKFSKAAQQSSLGRLVREQISDSRSKLDAIEFIEGREGLGVKLYPVQRVCVKAIFGIPFDKHPGMVPVWDKFRENLLYTFTEEEYLAWLYDQGRCNIGDWRDIPEGGYKEADLLVGRRGGKAIDVDELIPTPQGFVRNGDLEAGDTVFSPSGKPTKVLLAHEPFLSKVYRVHFDDGTSVVTHPEHLWQTSTWYERKNAARRSEYKPRSNRKRSLPAVKGVRTTEEILKTLTFGKRRDPFHAVQVTAPVEMERKNLPIDPYCFGVWLGDGSKDGILFSALEADGREYAKHFIAAGYSWVQDNKHPEIWHTYGWRSVLKKMGVYRNKHIPADYLLSSIEQRLALLQGLMDTDGCAEKDGASSFSNTNFCIAQGVYQLAASLGLKPYWSVKRCVMVAGVSCKPNSPRHGSIYESYQVKWTSDLEVFRLVHKLKRIPAKVREHQRWRSIIAIEPVDARLVRCITVDDPDGLFLFGENFNVTHNSQLISAIACYKLSLLLSVRSPQEYYNLVPGSPIDFTFLAQDDEGANRLYEKMREDVVRSHVFQSYLRLNTNTHMKFVTDADRTKVDWTPTIKVESFPCTTNAVRGPSSYFLALDEFAHFRSEKGASSEQVYEAANPATLNFVNHSHCCGGVNRGECSQGKRDSMIISLTSPWKKVGKYYDLHKLAMDKGPSSQIFTLRCSTAEMNPYILSSDLRQRFETSAATWKAEYGGEFLDSSETYVSLASIEACTEERPNLSQTINELIGKNYFWGFDLGTQHDGSALAIGHLEFIEPGKALTMPTPLGMTFTVSEKEKKGGIYLIYDYIDRMMVGEKFDGVIHGLTDMMSRYTDYKELPIEEIIAWLVEMDRRMPCFRGATDQHGGTMLVQMLQMNGITNMELLHLTPQINSMMFFALKSYIDQNKARFPNVPKFKHELQNVEATITAKYMMRVQAPIEKGAHDDMVDAVAIVAHLAANWLQKEGRLALDPTGSSLMMQQASVEQMLRPTVIPNINEVSMQDLQIMERQRRIMQSAGNAEAVSNPFGRHGSIASSSRGRGRGRR